MSLRIVRFFLKGSPLISDKTFNTSQCLFILSFPPFFGIDIELTVLVFKPSFPLLAKRKSNRYYCWKGEGLVEAFICLIYFHDNLLPFCYNVIRILESYWMVLSFCYYSSNFRSIFFVAIHLIVLLL